MKNLFSKLISLLLLLCIIIGSLASCELVEKILGEQGENPPQHEHVDYVSQVKLDMTSSTAKQEVTMKMHIDGDTTHFYVPAGFDSLGYIKARYLAVNTPESTGKIEEWGKAASKYTESKLTDAYKIIVESDTETWNFDGNGRYLVWVWYQPTADAEFRCLNIELLEAGLAVGSKTSECRYGDIAVKAINQATIEKLYVFSNDKDPDFPYDKASSLTVKELRLNPEEYEGKRVSVEGIVVYNSDYTVYIEDYDAETGITFGMQVFYGYNTTLHSVFMQGNKVRVVGVLNNFHGTWQISGIDYNPMKPKDPANTAKLETGLDVSFTKTTIDKFNSTVSFDYNDEQFKGPYTKFVVSTSISMDNLKVIDVYTTKTGDSAGAMTLTCQVDGKTIDVRTEVLKDANGNLITEQTFRGATIDVRGLVDYFVQQGATVGVYQIKVYTMDDITIH